MSGKRGAEGSSSGFVDGTYVTENPYGQEHPWELDDYMEEYGFISGFAQWLIGAITGRNNANEANGTVPASQIQAEQHEFDMAELQQKYHKENLVNDPSLQMQGYADAGISRNAAAQAILGSQSSFAPSGSSAGIGQSQMASNVVPALLQSLINAPVAQAQARNLDAQTAGQQIDNDFKPVMNQASLDKIYGELDVKNKEIGLKAEEIALQRLVVDSTLSLNAAQIQEKEALTRQIDANCQKLVAETDLLQKYSSHEIIKMSLTRKQIEKTDAEISVLGAQEANIKQDTLLKASQTEGQDIANDEAAIAEALADYRFQCSQILGLPLGDDNVSNFLISELNGNGAVYSDALVICGNGTIGEVAKVSRFIGFKNHSRKNRLSESFQPTWNIRRN